MNLNLFCPINTLSYGVLSLNFLEGLYKNNFNLALHLIGPLGFPESKRALLETTIQNSAFYDTKAPCLKIFHAHALKDMVGRGPQIGMIIFELFPLQEVEVHQINSLDLLIVPTQWAKDVCLSSGVKIPVEVVNLGVDRTIFNDELVPNNDIYNDTATKFLMCGKFEIRKGHDICVEVFNKAFNVGDNVRLIINCHNPFIGDDGNKQWQDMYILSPMGHKIHVFGDRLNNQNNVAGLMLSVDCGLFVSRAEGWNLPLLEMMSCGKHVITTNATAHTEFVSKENAMLVDVGPLEDAYDGVFFHGQGQWPSLTADSEEQIITHMREVHKLKQSGQLQKNIKGIETAKKFSWDKAAEKLMVVLKRFY